ncbi:hypothetical protein [Cupriavidus taiwanensis]|uniref:hypothetical protein n=1 Tax=Cupriavidus taiwanensis TaxID=164546 RepID=UPI0009DEE89F|nr:hypothetical protein [Cupriavidus taiwanensis]
MKLVFSYIDGGVHPTAGQAFHWHPVATGSIDAPRYGRYVCGVLGAVAQSTSDCDRLLSYLNAVESGREARVETGGNDVTLTLTPEGVQVDIESNDDWVGKQEGRFSLREWQLVIDGWKRFLAMPPSLESAVEVCL